ncbi:histidine phosphatase family protein [uncultured Algimonas sp.]|uniref:histidine phosphatase family protein n=1 Tax=uncultured Algimonas sp. TaxID=1547920 RepID=UPI002608B33E|nr:histidine phosphatase family protein [uncultured Algimonas sp.]
MRQIVIVRHGNTFDPGETVRRVGRGTDLPLSSSGRTQAAALAAHFTGTAFDRIVSSPLRRTRQTAQLIAAEMTGPDILFDDRLLEIDYGPDEGQPEAAVIARLGADAIARWDENAVPPRDWLVDPETIRTDWADLLAQSVGRTLIVTSNGIARFALDVARHDGAERKLKTGAYGIIDETPDHWRVTEWNIRP